MTPIPYLLSKPTTQFPQTLVMSVFPGKPVHAEVRV